MGQRRKPGVRDNPDERTMRDQEVLRANRDLAAYFKGQRTEREARAALKIIKAFVREREHQDPRSRPALPGAETAKMPKKLTNRETSGARGAPRQRTRRPTPRPQPSRTAVVSIERPANTTPSPESGEQES
jgi:hypothetical protein